jgi:ADP-heptose:LPS heptosyltransferase
MTRPNLYLKVFAPGIGDLVVILPILKNLKENYMNEVNVLVFNEAQASLLTRFPYVDRIIKIEEGKDYREIIKSYPPGNFYIDIAETEMESKYWWGSEEFIRDLGQMHIYDVMKKCIQIGGDYEKIEPLQFNKLEPANPFKKTILLGIGGRRGNKLWFNDYWLSLYHSLINSGYAVGMVGDRNHNGSDQLSQLEKEGIPFFETKNLGNCIDLISNSAGMITIDSGLMHISAMQGIPTVALFGPMPSWLWGPKAKHVINLDGGCGINCSKMPLDWECVGRPCMRSIGPLKVQDELEFLLERLDNE